MKTIIRQSAIAASLVIALVATALQTKAQNEKLVYEKAYNPSIGITVGNATGATYTIKDTNGNIILQGTVKSEKTFFIPTSKLGKGTYHFFIGNYIAQEFIIK